MHEIFVNWSLPVRLRFRQINFKVIMRPEWAHNDNDIMIMIMIITVA